MKIIPGKHTVPVIYTAHHASHDFDIFEDRVALTQEQKVRFSDYGTSETVPQNGIVSIVAETSRALGDLNRDPDDPGRFQDQDYAKPDRNTIWTENKELTGEEKLYCQSTYYRPFHQAIVDQLKDRQALTFVVAWDNTAHYEIGTDENNQPVTMKPIIISNRGIEGSAQASDSEETSCDPEFLELLVPNLANELQARNLPNDIYLNLVFKGGYITRHYSTLRNKETLMNLGITASVQSFQVEYDTAITHGQETLEPNPDNIQRLRTAFSKAIETTFEHYSDRFSP